jgi:hypothetical protein
VSFSPQPSAFSLRKKLKLLIIGLIFLPGPGLTQDYIGYYWTPKSEHNFFRENGSKELVYG